MFGAIAVERGCGTREEDGLYWELGFGPGGRDLADFLIDRPLQVPEHLHLAAVGMQAIVDNRGVVHLCDVVGREHYPNVADFAEEMARFGASRRMPKTLFDMTVEVAGVKRPVIECLTSDSRLLLAHDRAGIFNALDSVPVWGCPKGFVAHLADDYAAEMHDSIPEPVCLGACWRDVEGGKLVPDDERPSTIRNLLRPSAGQPVSVAPTPDERDFADLHQFVDPRSARLVHRAMPSFGYFAIAPDPDNETKPEYQRAFFVSLPASRLVVVTGPNSDAVLSEAERSQLPVCEVAQ